MIGLVGLWSICLSQQAERSAEAWWRDLWSMYGIACNNCNQQPYS